MRRYGPEMAAIFNHVQITSRARIGKKYSWHVFLVLNEVCKRLFELFINLHRVWGPYFLGEKDLKCVDMKSYEGWAPSRSWSYRK